uniref:Uncharacterized protein n=1 Tax=Anguilla anguilla TaxID=7936 RepID=A0A0E9S9E3_ANGAN
MVQLVEVTWLLYHPLEPQLAIYLHFLQALRNLIQPLQCFITINLHSDLLLCRSLFYKCTNLHRAFNNMSYSTHKFSSYQLSPVL